MWLPLKMCVHAGYAGNHAYLVGKYKAIPHGHSITAGLGRRLG
jgi:hypothetical protein